MLPLLQPLFPLPPLPLPLLFLLIALIITENVCACRAENRREVAPGRSVTFDSARSVDFDSARSAALRLRAQRVL